MKRRLGHCAVLLLGAAMASRAAAQQTVRFNPRLVFGGAAEARDVSQFDRGNPVPCGNYRSRVFLNGASLGTRVVKLRVAGAAPVTQVCLDRDLLRRLDLDPRRLHAAARAWLGTHDAPDCEAAPRIAPGLHAAFDLTRLRVDITAPQRILQHRPLGWVSPAAWNNGIDAARLNYQLNAVRSRRAGAASGQTQIFLGLSAGFNLGAWQFRHRGTLSGAGVTGLHYLGIASDLRHDVAGLGGYVQLGQGHSDGRLFDSVAYRGVLLASDPRMQPPSERGFAPVIRGFAAAPAIVRVRQSGVLLYQTSVPAGSFRIDDLYPPAAGAPLQVSVRQLDGAVSGFSVPVSLLPQLQRPGHASYQLLAGRMRPALGAADWPVLLGSLLYGFDNVLTGEFGVLAARGYADTALGAAFNTSVGALALELARSRFDLPAGRRRRGLRLRGTWSLARGRLDLNLRATYRSVGYYGAQDALDSGPGAAAPSPPGRARDDLQVQFTQALGAAGEAYLSGARTRYWNAWPRQTTLQFGWTRSFGAAQLTLAFSRQIGSAGGGAGNALSLSLSLPLGSVSSAPTMRFGVQRDGGGRSSAQWDLSGGSDTPDGLGYGLQAGAGQGTRNLGVNASWRSAGGSFAAAATQSEGARGTIRALSLDASGGVVAFDGGVTFTPYLGNTIALIEAPAARGAAVLGDASRIDAHGYGVATYLTPYQYDTVGIDLARAALLQQGSARVVPRAGAIVAVPLRRRRGRWVLISGRRAGGAPLPFAAQVLGRAGRLVGYVGQGSRIDAHLRHESGRLLVRWGRADTQACELGYRLPAARVGARPLRLRGAVCATPARSAAP